MNPEPNPMQWEAVRRADRHVLVAAGAGTGKTTTVVGRILWLLGAEIRGERREPPIGLRDIGAITYTNAAAADLKRKLRSALREAGLARIPLPQLRQQVPERWRRDWPLPAWSAAYGAGLGAGFLTFQPVATFWVACGAALALGRPLLAACCFALYGAGRALMAVGPRRREPDGAAAVERLVARTALVSRANAAPPSAR